MLFDRYVLSLTVTEQNKKKKKKKKQNSKTMGESQLHEIQRRRSKREGEDEFFLS